MQRQTLAKWSPWVENEKWQNYAKYHFFKDISVVFFKIVALVLKFKLRKTCEKRGWNHSTVGLCRKRLKKQANIRKIATFI